jgi:competence protein CoiA
MKFAIVDGLRCEAQPKLRGECSVCNADVVAKCGVQRIWHWAHVSTSNCDHWWEPETQWHRNWKSEFPEQLQEVRQASLDGEVHIADVKTEDGIVLEFQHSSISLKERISRENFYRQMVWVVNGRRLERDLSSFQKALMLALPVGNAHLKLLLLNQACILVKRWAGSRCPIYVDFGNAVFDVLRHVNEPVLWKLEFLVPSRRVVATPVSRRSFLERHRDNGRLRGFPPPPLQPVLMPQPRLLGFERYLRKQEARRRRRFNFL